MSEKGFVPYRPERPGGEDMRRRGEEFRRAMAARRSVRFFSDEAVPRELIETAIMTAGSAPSGAHMQPWTFVAVSDPAIKKKIRVAAEEEEYQSYEGGRMKEEWLEDLRPLGTDWRKPFLETVPWIVVVFAQKRGRRPDGSPKKHYYVQESVGIACGLFIAALHQAGLATLTHTPSPMRFLREILRRPDDEEPFILFPVGFPAADCVVPDLRRKALEEIAVFLEGEGEGRE